MRTRRSGFDGWRADVLALVWDMNNGLHEWSIPELAAKADLAPVTVWRLFTGRTKDPKARTIYKLTKAVGLWMEVVEEVQQANRKVG